VFQRSTTDLNKTELIARPHALMHAWQKQALVF